MQRKSRARIPGALASCLLASACVGEESVLFVTTTNIGIDADTTPPNVAIAYDRYEGYFGPSYASGALPPVYARLQSNNSIFNPKIQQTYATGEAAKLISKQAGCPECEPNKPEPELKGKKKIAFAGTTATVGLKVTFSPEGPPESVALGYKRKEYSLIPVMTDGEGEGAKDTYASVVAAFGINAATSKIGDAGLGVSQFFATGVAAQNVARDPDIQALFKEEAKSSFLTYAPDQNSQVIRQMRQQAGFDEKVKEWLKQQGNNDCKIAAELENLRECAALREKAVINFSRG